MTGTIDDFLKKLAEKESSNNAQVVNSLGYAGLYQMGEAALADTGYYKKPSGRYDNSWTGSFTGKDGIYCLKDFLDNRDVQNKAVKQYMQKQWGYMRKSHRYLYETIGDVNITPAALLGGAHIGGHSNVAAFLKSGGKINEYDKNGKSVKDYMVDFGDYDVSEITGKATSRNMSQEEWVDYTLRQRYKNSVYPQLRAPNVPAMKRIWLN